MDGGGGTPLTPPKGVPLELWELWCCQSGCAEIFHFTIRSATSWPVNTEHSYKNLETCS